jgi:hypothetical protein
MIAGIRAKSLQRANRAWDLVSSGCVIFAIGFLIVSSGTTSADFKTGLSAYERNDYAVAFREWFFVAEQGDALAQFYVARMYEEGKGVRRSFGEARRWYDRAAATLPPGEERERAIRGRDRVAFELAKMLVDPGVVGSWRLMVPDPASGTAAEWLLDINDAGDFWFKITRATASRSEQGTFRAKDGKWQWTTRNEEQSGSYRVIDADAIEITGVLGTARWTRVRAFAQQSIDVSPKPRGLPQKPGLLPGSKDLPPVPKGPESIIRSGAFGRVLFEDDFRSKHQLLAESGPFCKTSYGDGGFIVEDVAPQGICRLVLSNAGEFQASVRIEVSTRLRRGGQNYGYGLMFGRAQDGRTYYTLTINKDGYHAVSLNQDGKWTPLLEWKQDPAIKVGYGATNRIAVEVQSRTIRVFVNDKQVGLVQGPANVAGKIGFYLDLMGMETVFSDLRVTELAPSGSSPQVSPKPSAPTVAGGRVLFQDDFRSQRLGAEVSECAKTSYADGFIMENIDRSNGCRHGLLAAGKFADNVRIELSARQRKGRQDAGYGLMFGKREGDDSILYSLFITADGFHSLWLISSVTDFKLLIPWTRHTSVRTGYEAANQLAVEIQGRTIRTFVNGTQVGSVQAPAPVTGFIGFAVGTPGMEVVFTNVRVVELAKPEATSRAHQP